jgi:glycosyltransferase involved in cell wall biosynthesis
MRSDSNGPALRILCISPFIAPHHDSEAFCSAKFVSALTNCGASVRVITFPSYGSTDLDDSPIWQSVQTQVVHVLAPAHRDGLQSLRMALAFRTLIYARWIGAVLGEAKRLHQECRFDLVYSRSLPMFSHIAGYWISRGLGLPWVANINDPWDWHLFPVGGRPKTSALYASMSNHWMRKTLRSADLVTYPSEKLKTYHVSVSGVQHKSLVIPHVGNRLAAKPFPRADRRLRIFELVHAGKLGSNEFTGRSIMALLQGLRLFLRDFPEAEGVTQLTLVGPQDKKTQSQIDELGLQSSVRNVGKVNYEDSLRYIQGATVCVLVEADAREGIFLPSKLVDYISARKPVLALSPCVGVVADLVPQGGIMRVDPRDSQAVRIALGRLYQDYQNHTLNHRTPSEEQVSQFYPEIVAEQFLATIRQISRSKQLQAESRHSSDTRAKTITAHAGGF